MSDFPTDLSDITDNVDDVLVKYIKNLEAKVGIDNSAVDTSQDYMIRNGWILANETWTFASASTITVPAGATSKYQKGDRIRWTQSTVKYGVIVDVADTLLTIAVNTDYVVTDAEITLNYYSHQQNPIGYPSYFNFTPTINWTAGSAPATPTEYSRFCIEGKIRTDFYNVKYTDLGTTVTGATIGFSSSYLASGGCKVPLVKLFQDATEKTCIANVFFNSATVITVTCASASVNRIVGSLQYQI